jgi:dTDP-4-amino-4,6-dideoxygalactose transaminase
MKIEVHSPTIRRKEMDAVLTVLVEEKIGPGEQSQRLIQIAKSHLHFDFAIAMRSPAMALLFALKFFKQNSSEANCKKGVLVSALSPRYYTGVIADAGMRAIICDVDPATACVSPETIRAAIERDTDETPILCMALNETLGFLPNMQAISEMGIPLIEDCSAAYDSSLGEKKAGTFGLVSILGLEEHDMITAGGGALLFSMEKRNSSVLRSFSDLPAEYGLPDMNAAMSVVQLREIERNAEKLDKIARLYTDAALRGGRHKFPVMAENFRYNNYAFPLILETGMKDVTAYAKKKEIDVKNAFERTLASAGLVQHELCPNACSLALRTALFPIYPRLDEESANKVAKLIRTLP